MPPQPFLSLVIELVDRSSGLDKTRFFVKIRFVVYSLVLYKRIFFKEANVFNIPPHTLFLTFPSLDPNKKKLQPPPPLLSLDEESKI